MYGGPPNPTTHEGMATGQPMPSFVVKVVHGRTVVATAMSDTGGRYTLLYLRPGSYGLVCGGSSVRFTVAAGSTTSADCAVNVG
jgi:hypothetical protein